MSNLINNLITKAQLNPKRVALPECEAENTLLAARELLDKGIGFPVLVNRPTIIEETAQKVGVSLEGMEIINIDDEAAVDALLERYMVEPRMLSAKGYRKRIVDPVYYAMILEAVGDVDCTFCGHTNTTGDVLIAAQNVIGMQDGVSVPSIIAIVEVPGFDGPEGDTIVFTDCGLNPEPDPDELASIAIAACDNVRILLDWEPRAAFLSFSTDGSGKAHSVLNTREAIEIARTRRPDLSLDGEFQLDAAIDPKVAASKVKRESAVAGKANILVFPDLDAANVAVKLIQRFANGKAYGHTLSGFRLPVADSSRSASVEEIIGDIAMVVIAASDKENVQ
jgi:phosphate acetyltransferase